MSKYLIKILAICAFVMLLPLAAVATSLAVVGTREYTLRVDIAGDTNTSASANVLINGQNMDLITVVAGTTVELSFESTGYDFLGWYEGTEGTYKPDAEPISNQARFSLKITDNTDLTAVCISKQYTVNYTGFKEDGVTEISYSKDGYEYGEALDIPTKANEDSIAEFVGWRVVGGTETYTSATFPQSGVVTVLAVWSDTKIVTYYDAQGQVISSSSRYYNSETIGSFNLMSASDAENYVSDGHHFVRFKYLESNVEINADEVERIKNNFNTTPLNIQIVEEKDVYNLTFTGFNETGVEDTGLNRQCQFEDNLPTTERTGFNGWTIDGSGDVYTKANFSNYENGATINLVANWSDKQVTFVYADQHSAPEEYTKAEFDALTLEGLQADAGHITDGYHADGWTYQGSALTDTVLKSMQKGGYDSTPITLTVNETVNTYNISYTGYLEDGTTEIDQKDQVNYQGALMIPEKANAESKASFRGWRIEGDQSNNLYTSADFVRDHNADVTLVAVWDNALVVTYYNGDTAVSTQEYNETAFANFQLKTEDELLALAGAINQGYDFVKFTNKDTGADITAETIETIKDDFANAGKALNISIVQAPIDYTLNISGFVGSEESSITITVDNYDALTSWNPSRYYYTFNGLRYNSNLYTADQYANLVDAIISQRETTTIDLTAEWTCEIDVANFESFYKIGNDGMLTKWDNDAFFFNTDSATEMEDTLLEAFFGEVSESGVITFEGVQYKVSSIVTYYENNADSYFNVGDINTYTFTDLAFQLDGYKLSEKETFANGLRIEFTFEPVNV